MSGALWKRQPEASATRCSERSSQSLRRLSSTSRTVSGPISASPANSWRRSDTDNGLFAHSNAPSMTRLTSAVFINLIAKTPHTALSQGNGTGSCRWAAHPATRNGHGDGRPDIRGLHDRHDGRRPDSTKSLEGPANGRLSRQKSSRTMPRAPGRHESGPVVLPGTTVCHRKGRLKTCMREPPRIPAGTHPKVRRQTVKGPAMARQRDSWPIGSRHSTPSARTKRNDDAAATPQPFRTCSRSAGIRTTARVAAPRTRENAPPT